MYKVDFIKMLVHMNEEILHQKKDSLYFYSWKEPILLSTIMILLAVSILQMISSKNEFHSSMFKN